ncbi:MAG: class I SAM-dependent methyltransferase [Stenotrophomonas acidaminiphila]
MQVADESRRGFDGMSSLGIAMEALSPVAHMLETRALDEGRVFGFCRGCGIWGWFFQPAQAEGWANLSEGMLCACGLNGRMRGVLAVVDDVLARMRDVPRAAVFERLTPLFEALFRRVPGVTGSEFLGDKCRPGELVDRGGRQVRHESMDDASYASESLELVMHFDVLEHVPDPLAALRECHRILVPGGRLVFSTPFYEGLNASIRRARLRDGVLVHDLPAAYHGNPVDEGGALVFTQFGQDLFDMVAASGFCRIEAWLAFNPVEGVFSNGCPYPDGHAWPVVFVATKPMAAA